MNTNYVHRHDAIKCRARCTSQYDDINIIVFVNISEFILCHLPYFPFNCGAFPYHINYEESLNPGNYFVFIIVESFVAARHIKVIRESSDSLGVFHVNAYNNNN